MGFEAGAEKQGPGVGVWRDGKYLVMHRDAKLPARCIYTNEPAVISRTQKLKWSYQVDYARRTMPLEYGLSDEGLRRVERTRRNWMLLGGCSAVGAVIAVLCVVIGFMNDVIWLAEGVGHATRSIEGGRCRLPGRRQAQIRRNLAMASRNVRPLASSAAASSSSRL